MRQTERVLLEKERDRLARRIPRLEAKVSAIKREYEEEIDDAEDALTLARRQHADLVNAVGESKPKAKGKQA